MTVILQSYLSGIWQEGHGQEGRGQGGGSLLRDPVTGEELARASGEGLDLAAALAYARQTGGPALRALSFSGRAKILADIASVLADNKARYGEITLRNSGTNAADAVLDIDGGIGTLKYYASLGRKLGEGKLILEPGSDQLTRDETFRAQHIWTPLRGVAVHINAFNFPSWGLWEKAAVSILAGVPFLSKPATATAWLAYEMVRDVVAKGVVPAGVLSLLCGGGRDLMDHLLPGDVVSFTGSAETALGLKSHANVLRQNIRFAVEADSLNLSALGPDVASDSPLFAAFIKEVTKELSIKAGQKCTAIRRILVPRAALAAVTSALSESLSQVTIGDPRDGANQMGPLVSKAQQAAAWEGLDKLSSEAEIVFGGQRDFVPAGLDSAVAAFFPPTLLLCQEPLKAKLVHEIEVFGPVATLLPYDSLDDAVSLAHLGGGSLAASIFTNDTAFAIDFVPAIASAHGRVLLVDESVAKSHSGHGVVMPHSIHGGPGRAGGGEELGGLRGLRFYLQRTAIQSSQDKLTALTEGAASVTL